jgi:hypothetical protein
MTPICYADKDGNAVSADDVFPCDADGCEYGCPHCDYTGHLIGYKQNGDHYTPVVAYPVVEGSWPVEQRGASRSHIDPSNAQHHSPPERPRVLPASRTYRLSEVAAEMQHRQAEARRLK